MNYGQATLTNCLLQGNTISSNGGAILNYGQATLTNCLLQGNTAFNGGAIWVGNGVGIILTNCLLQGNTASSSGGAIYRWAGTMTFTDPLTRLVGNTPPQFCPAGQHISGISYGTATCATCQAGKTTPDSGYFKCSSCPPGQGLTGSDTCTNCTAGKFSNANSCTPCAAGTYQGETGRESCKACANYTFADVAGLEECKVCEPGTTYDKEKVALGTGQNPCQSCRAGTYRETKPSEMDNNCTACAEGKASPQTGANTSSTCVQCLPGKAAAQPGMFVCVRERVSMESATHKSSASLQGAPSALNVNPESIRKHVDRRTVPCVIRARQA